MMSWNHAIVFSLILVLLCSGCVSQDNETGKIPVEANENTTPTTYFVTATTTTPGAEPYLYFRFFENATKCRIHGNATLNNNSLGETSQLMLRVNKSEFSSMGDFEKENSLCIEGVINDCDGIYNNWKIKLCWLVNFSANYFDYYNGAYSDFSGNAGLTSPGSYHEATNFVRPNDMKDFVEHQEEIGYFSGNENEDIEKIWQYVDSHVSYRYDSDVFGQNVWKMPNETMKGWGDCEDWTNLFVSIARAYNESVNCYSVKLPTHLTAFCKSAENNKHVYGFYDQNTKVKNFADAYENEREKIRQVIEWYFSEYEIENENKMLMAAFNEKEYFIFQDNEQFIEWAQIL